MIQATGHRDIKVSRDKEKQKFHDLIKENNKPSFMSGYICDDDDDTSSEDGEDQGYFDPHRLPRTTPVQQRKKKKR